VAVVRLSPDPSKLFPSYPEYIYIYYNMFKNNKNAMHTRRAEAAVGIKSNIYIIRVVRYAKRIMLMAFFFRFFIFIRRRVHITFTWTTGPNGSDVSSQLFCPSPSSVFLFLGRKTLFYLFYYDFFFIYLFFFSHSTPTV
jgi:hypothetical protein